MDHPLTKVQALEALQHGEKIAHRYFSSDEWVVASGAKYLFEDGCTCEPASFWRYRHGAEWNKDWRVVPSKKPAGSPQ